MSYQIEEVDIQDLLDDAENANLGTARGRELLDTSLTDLGVGRSLVTDKKGRIAAGNKTKAAAVRAGLQRAIVIKTSGDALIVHQREDWDLEQEDADNPARRYAYIDNWAGFLDLQMDPIQILKDAEKGVPLDQIFSPEELEGLLALAEISEILIDDEEDSTGFAEGAQFSNKVVASIPMTRGQLNEHKADLYRWCKDRGLDFKVRSS